MFKDLFVVQAEDSGFLHGLAAGFQLQGFEPHLAVLGKKLVASTSLALTRELREAAEGRTPGIASTEGHRSMGNLVDPKAVEVSFIDGDRLVSAIGLAVSDVVTLSVKDRQTRSFVEALMGALRCFRGHAYHLSGDGDALVSEEWIRFSDPDQR